MPQGRKKVKALVLFSGGLDSILAAKILEAQGIHVTALTFVSYFFNAGQAKKSAAENGIELVIRDISPKHFAIVKNPCFGRGAGMNPCIDCRFLMLKIAKKIARDAKFDLIATGEILGQRPMSQNLGAFRLMEKQAKLVGKILRPLSALALPETEMEKSGLIERSRLHGISGRSRKAQMELAEKFGVKHYPAPAGGCILTDKEFSKKLGELVRKAARPKASDFKLLGIGRHFWVHLARSHFENIDKNETSDKNFESGASNGAGTRIIVGRRHEENLQLKKLAEKGDILVEPKDVPGPTVLVRGKRNKAVLDAAEKLLLKYTKKADQDISLKITVK